MSRAPRLLTCFAALALIDASTRLLGMRRTFAIVRRLTRGVQGNGSPATLVQQTTHRVVLAAAFYPRRAECLEQALALYLLLRRRGVAAELKLGVQPLPFYAHAWVEVDGQPVHEQAGAMLQFATFSGLGV